MKKTQFDLFKEEICNMTAKEFVENKFTLLNGFCNSKDPKKCPNHAWQGNLAPCEVCMLNFLESEVEEQ